MFHTIEFTAEVLIDLEISPKHRLEQLLIRPGDRVLGQIRPYIVETELGLIEVADLFLENGTTLCRVPFECFAFAD